MSDVKIRKGNLEGKGTYANRNFKKGEVVIKYNLKPLTKEEYEKLSENLKNYVHTHFGQLNLYSEPERYVNHSKNPNTTQNLKEKCDIATRDIKKGEEVTTNATKDDIS
ncbi:SET domain-containing protein [Candidatus Pacearchaeota archaeon]|nr:SET domain-containing protein [Candidatus Pacearchaeota archaeon]